jgi:exonuclease VII small subunit
MNNPEKYEDVEVTQELFSLSVEEIKEIINRLEDDYKNISKDSRFEEEKKDLSKIILNLENRIKSLEN